MWKLSQAVSIRNFSLHYQRSTRSVQHGVKYMVAFLWDDPKLDHSSEITRITVHQRSRWILAQSCFTGSFDTLLSKWSWISDPISDHPKKRTLLLALAISHYALPYAKGLALASPCASSGPPSCKCSCLMSKSCSLFTSNSCCFFKHTLRCQTEHLNVSI